jgi:hypothetical protein
MIRWILIILGLIFAVLWMFLVVSGMSGPDWIPPASVLALGIALALPA